MTVQMAPLTLPFSADAVAELAQRHGEPDWLREWRLDAFQAFETLGLPRLERTDLSKVNLADYGLSTEAAASLPADVQATLTESNDSERAGLFVQSNGTVVQARLNPDLARRGVILTSLAEAVQTQPALVQKHLGRVVMAAEGKLEALNTAFWSGGLFLYIPRNVIVDEPIQVIFYADAPGGSVFPRSLVVAEESAAVTILEEHISPHTAAPLLAVPVSEVVAGENAQVKIVHLQNWGPNVTTFVTQRGDSAKNASVGWTLGHLGAKLMRSYTETRLMGEGATTEMLGVQFGTGQQHHDIYTLMNHIAPLTDGDLLFRGVLRDEARSVFEGLIKIHPGAQDSNSYLHDNTLLLSREARADSIPSLEIEANQVRASHGATVSHVDEDWVFYLRTRGLSYQEAIRTIVDGFFAPIMQRITLPSVRNRLRAAFDEKMEAGQMAWEGSDELTFDDEE